MITFSFVFFAVIVLVISYLTYFLVRFFRYPPSDFFLSHSGQDHAAAKAIERELRAMSKTAWLDSSQPETKIEFRRPISAALHRCHSAVLVTSRDYVKSSNCREEAELLVRKFRGDPGRLIEVCLESNSIRQIICMSERCPRIDVELDGSTKEWKSVAAAIIRLSNATAASTDAHETKE